MGARPRPRAPLPQAHPAPGAHGHAARRANHQRAAPRAAHARAQPRRGGAGGSGTQVRAMRARAWAAAHWRACSGVPGACGALPTLAAARRAWRVTAGHARPHPLPAGSPASLTSTRSAESLTSPPMHAPRGITCGSWAQAPCPPSWPGPQRCWPVARLAWGWRQRVAWLWRRVRPSQAQGHPRQQRTGGSRGARSRGSPGSSGLLPSLPRAP